MSRLFAIAFFVLCGARSALADFNVTSLSDSGAGTLRQAIIDANNAGGGTINITVAGQITLQNPLPNISTGLNINGGNAMVSGNDQFRVFFVDAPSANLTLNNLTIMNGRAKGGDGAPGAGGGLGAGGGIFINQGNVTVSNVTFLGNSAVGGAGGRSGNGGGGGGLGGNGVDGGGGYYGNGGKSNSEAAGGGGGFDANGADANDGVGGNGGGEGGIGSPYGGGIASSGGGGGGGSFASPGHSSTTDAGGAGGRFGGGGAGYVSSAGGNGGEFGGGGSGTRGGNGGFGGGGGFGDNVGGNGGFGGGGAGSDAIEAYGNAGAFGGMGSSIIAVNQTPASNYYAGGGGAALGGTIFVRGGASLTLVDSSTNGDSVTPGAGGITAAGPDGQAGLGAGSSFFLAGKTTISVSAGKMQYIAGSIVDIGDFSGSATAAGFNFASLYKTGTGTLLLQKSNDYRGGTTISQGVVVAEPLAPAALGTGILNINDASTGAADTAFITNNGAMINSITVANQGTGTTTIGSGPINDQPTIFTGIITLNKNIIIQAGNFVPLSALDEPGQTCFDSIISGPGGVTITGGHMVQFREGAKMYTGPTTVTGNSILSLYDSGSTPINSVVQIDTGSSVVLENLVGGNAAIAGLNGTGTLANNDARGLSSLQVGSSDASAVSTFTGKISGSINITKTGTDTFRLGAQNDATLSATLSNGRLALLGDLRIGDFFFNDSPAGTQAVDLAGHAIIFHPPGIELSSKEPLLNHEVGNSADGLYDSTLLPNQDIGLAPTADGFTIKKTISGDTNLDGKVDFTDLVVLAQHYGTNEGRWRFGDVTHDGKVDFADLVKIAQNYGDALPSEPIPGAPADFQIDLAAAFAQVPEPAHFASLIVFGFATLPRRRIRK